LVIDNNFIIFVSMETTHGFALRAHDLKGLFDKTNKISTFMRKLEAQALIDPARYDRDKYVGDGFEFFVELFLKSHAYDNRIGITKYTPIQNNDNGVDGIGYNLSNEKCVVQVKYRSNNQTFLTTNTDHLGNMIVEGMLKHDVVKPKDNSQVPRYYVITTAKGLHHYTDGEVFSGFVKCIAYDDLRAMLDNNISFWNLCREVVQGYEDKKAKV